MIIMIRYSNLLFSLFLLCISSLRYYGFTSSTRLCYRYLSSDLLLGMRLAICCPLEIRQSSSSKRLSRFCSTLRSVKSLILRWFDDDDDGDDDSKRYSRIQLAFPCSKLNSLLLRQSFCVCYQARARYSTCLATSRQYRQLLSWAKRGQSRRLRWCYWCSLLVTAISS